MAWFRRRVHLRSTFGLARQSPCCLRILCPLIIGPGGGLSGESSHQTSSICCCEDVSGHLARQPATKANGTSYEVIPSPARTASWGFRFPSTPIAGLDAVGVVLLVSRSFPGAPPLLFAVFQCGLPILILSEVADSRRPAIMSIWGVRREKLEAARRRYRHCVGNGGRTEAVLTAVVPWPRANSPSVRKRRIAIVRQEKGQAHTRGRRERGRVWPAFDGEGLGASLLAWVSCLIHVPPLPRRRRRRGVGESSPPEIHTPVLKHGASTACGGKRTVKRPLLSFCRYKLTDCQRVPGRFPSLAEHWLASSQWHPGLISPLWTDLVLGPLRSVEMLLQESILCSRFLQGDKQSVWLAVRGQRWIVFWAGSPYC